jgi:hypothetical protein|tara:strand:- start:48 stop:206 length:159 start_codon:yes stop_codon:yes gene_type:complete
MDLNRKNNKKEQEILNNESYWAGKILESRAKYKKWLYDACKLDYDKDNILDL